MMTKLAVATIAVVLGVLVLPMVLAQTGPVASVNPNSITELDARRLFMPEQFVFNFTTPETETPGGNLRPNTIKQNPLLATLPGNGAAQNLVTLEACSINQPHVHPRGTEVSFITEGELFFGFHEENGGRFISSTITKGTTIVIPQGLMHFAHNRSCKRAQFLANFPNRDPGTQTTAANFFMLPDDTLAATMGVSVATIKRLKTAALASKNPSRDMDCMKRCGLGY